MKRPGKPAKPKEPTLPPHFVEEMIRVRVYDREFVVCDMVDKFVEKLIRERYFRNPKVLENVAKFILENPDRLGMDIENDDYDDPSAYFHYNILEDDRLIPNDKYDVMLAKYNVDMEMYPQKLAAYEVKFAEWKSKEADFVRLEAEKTRKKIEKLQDQLKDLEK